MTSYSNNAYDVANFFVVLKSSWPILFLPCFIVVGHQMVELTAGGGVFASSIQYIRVCPYPIQNRVKNNILKIVKIKCGEDQEE